MCYNHIQNKSKIFIHGIILSKFKIILQFLEELIMIPQLKSYVKNTNEIEISKIKWIFEENEDERIISAATKIAISDGDGFPIEINAGNSNDEEYKICISSDKISILSNSKSGAFYALKTIKYLLKENDGKLICGKITDYPDMEYRGFYHDITRGRVPKLETLKKLVDTMACYKLNSLQLYVEHAFDFKEYDFCKEKLGYMTKEETIELDKYCRENFIELVPSLATFGHLYHLLNEGKYKHLSELPNFVPELHHFKERMAHHTINPLLDESFELIKSLIDQYLECFTSDKFNICCDETFDLCSDVNKGKDKGKLYFDFVSKIINYLVSKGKKVFMWGDIIIQHPEYISKLPKDVTFLNWCYEANPEESSFKVFSENDKPQIVCPGTTTWNGFSELVNTEQSNIYNMANFGYKYGAKGILNTNWGDFGNPCSIDMAMYGLICGAAIGWDKNVVFDKNFRKEVSLIHYGNEKAVDIIAGFEKSTSVFLWGNVILRTLEHLDTINDPFESIKNCKKLHDIIESETFKNDRIKKELLSAVDGYALMNKWFSSVQNKPCECYVNFKSWEQNYIELWNSDNKKSELDELLLIFKKSEVLS